MSLWPTLDDSTFKLEVGERANLHREIRQRDMRWWASVWARVEAEKRRRVS